MRPLLTLCLVGAVLGCQPGAPAGLTDAGAPATRGTSASTGSPSGPAAAARSVAAAWPALPATPEALASLVARRTERPVGDWRALDPESVLAAVRAATGAGTIAAGWPAIVAALQATMAALAARGRSVYLLVGSFHDAPEQLVAFRRLTGALGLAPPLLVAIEQLRSDGHWQAAPALQRGDDALLGRYLQGGDAAALAELERGQRAHDYAAVKYDYVEHVLDVVSEARAAARPLGGCDMPGALQAHVRALLGPEGDVLRDLHCALTLAGRLGGSPPPHRVALFVGDAHLAPARLPRFLPPASEIVRVHLLGGRDASVGLERRLAPTLTVAAPLLVPLAAGRLVLLLPDRVLGARVDRIRTTESVPENERQSLVLEGFSGRGQIGTGPVTLAGHTRLAVGAGDIPFVLPNGRAVVAGVVRLAPSGAARIAREPDGTVTIHTRLPPDGAAAP